MHCNKLLRISFQMGALQQHFMGPIYPRMPLPSEIVEVGESAKVTEVDLVCEW